MTQTVGMIALRDFEDDGKLYFQGDRFQVTPIRAVVIKHARHARLTTPEDGPDPEPAVDAAPIVTSVKAITAEKPKRQRKPRAPRPDSKSKRRDIVRAPITK